MSSDVTGFLDADLRPGGETCLRKEDGVPLRVSAILATVALAVATAGMSNGAPTAFPGKPGRIAYNVAASGKGVWISTISPVGSRIRRLITTRADAFSPSWSADGRRIVFVIGSSIWRVNGRRRTG
jgi:hypothetical protein